MNSLVGAPAVSAIVALCCFLSLGVQAVEVPAAQSRNYDVPPEDFFHDFELAGGALTAAKKKLDDHGVSPSVEYYGDFFANPVGGEHQAASWIQLLTLGVDFDLEKLIGWKGATLSVSATDVAGSDLSLQVGNVFTIAQAYNINTLAFYNLYLEQTLLDDKLTLRIGRMSSGDDFAALPVFGLPVSAAVNGNPTSLFLNAPFTSTGSAVWAAYLKYQPSDSWYFDAGVYQANDRVNDPAYHGLDFSIRPEDGVLVIAETGWTPTFGQTSGKDKSADSSSGYSGVYTFGAYYSHYEFDTFSGGTLYDTYGFYWLAQQEVWISPADSNENIVLWGGLTWAPQTNIAQMPLMGFGGATWQGPIPHRDQDSLLFAAYAGAFSDDYAAAQIAAGEGDPTVETVLELSYIIQINEALQFQPDVQYIIQPSGLRSIPNALVLGFQVSASF